ncbi:uncharacterized protein LOC126790925 [Argentina anserina]|uniref:uncharacterized protein LOC126790925 n=1 Tax=Argentina anserina TaxID=57926 RepID=UPI0021765883|nr:uncharacterized protein LOC126790925 [Potentilla anserina]
MSLSSWKLANGALPPSVGENRLPTKPLTLITSKRALPPQVRSEGKQESGPRVLGVSRRDLMLSLPAATLAAVTLFSAEPAEARIVKLEIKRKIREKLEMLREKAGLSKPKNNEGKQPAASSPPAPVPSPQVSPIVPPVEAILP